MREFLWIVRTREDQIQEFDRYLLTISVQSHVVELSGNPLINIIVACLSNAFLLFVPECLLKDHTRIERIIRI